MPDILHRRQFLNTGLKICATLILVTACPSVAIAGPRFLMLRGILYPLAKVTAPEYWEWVYVYVPMSVLLLFASAWDLQSNRVPNWMTLPAFAYFLGVRLIFESDRLVWILLGTFTVSIMVIAYGFQSGLLGGGAVKLVMAVCAGLPFSLAAKVFVGVIIVAMLVARMQRRFGLEKFPGSLSVAFVTVVVVGLSTYFCRSP